MAASLAAMQIEAPAAGERAVWLGRIEACLAGVIVFLLSSALVGPLLDPNEVETPALRLMWPPVYGVMLVLAACRWRRLVRFWFPAALAFLLVFWAYATKYWSIDPAATGRRVIALFMTTLFGVYLGAAFPGRRLVEVLGRLFLLIGLGSLLVCLADPQLGVHHGANAGDWRGLWYEKNQMGAMMVVGALSALCAARAAPKAAGRWLAVFALCTGLLAMTRSATSLLCLSLALVATLVLMGLRRNRISAVATVWAGATAGAAGLTVSILKPELILVALGKDATLTGRTGIWAAVMRRLSEHPWLGYGYAAFWLRTSDPAKQIRKETGWLVPSAHNGWLDLLVQVGAIGAAIYGLVFLIAAGCAFVRSRRLRDGDFTLLYLLVFGVVTLSESFIMLHNNLSWALFVACLTRAAGPAPEPDPGEAWTRRAAAA